ncbi:MAG: phosphoribosyltransferase family protein, partial [Paracoccaceae bacterium]
GERVRCDDCLTLDRPWTRGRAALLYKDNARRLVLALKHGDRAELARPAASWMARAAAPILQPGMVAAPVPLHRLRLFRRRFNQAALLAHGIARETGLELCPDLLLRRRVTEVQDGKGVEARFVNMSGAITAHPRRQARLAGRHVLLVDDVMTSGATLAAATEACLEAGAAAVSVLVLARVAKAS